MPKALVCLVNGFEELEAVAPVDILRRGGVDVTLASVSGELNLTGSHDIKIVLDTAFDDIDPVEFDMIVLPGGPGTQNYKQYKKLLSTLEKFDEKSKYIGAICAAPSILGMLNLLCNKRAVCYPGYEAELAGAVIVNEPVVTDGNIITSKGAGTAVVFGLELLSALMGREAAKTVAESIQM